MHEPRPHHLFVVEDDVALREMLAGYLGKQGFVVTTLGSAEQLMRRIHRLRPDLVVLDVNLPCASGLEACRRLRADGDRVPIVLLTARADEVDKVLGLEMGADDYVTKPFSARELLARIRAVLRRAAALPGAPRAGAAPVAIGRLRFETQIRALVGPGGELRMLGSVEYALLAELVANPQVPLSRERLLAASHGRAEGLLERTVDVAVMRLRKLVEPDPAAPRYIQTVRGHGYMFVPPTRREAAAAGQG
jgi:two-component system phosphate regulon response regulator OmpR